jgi:hypothetical protein
MISFAIVKNNVNEQVFNQLIERLGENTNEKLELIYNSDSLVREYILQKEKK